MDLETVKCDICNSLNYKLLFKTKDIQFENNGQFDIVKCENCGLIYLNPRPTKKEIEKYYPKEYKPYQSKDEKSEKSRKTSNIFYKVMRFLAGKKSITGINEIFDKILEGKVLDLGCGSGELLKELKEKGFECYGVEMDKNAVEICRKNNLKVIQGDIQEYIKKINAKFDVIILSHVLEHLYNPSFVIREISRILADDGVFIIAIPSADSLMFNLFKSKWHSIDSPRHLYLFSTKTLSSLLQKYNLAIEEKHNYITYTEIAGTLYYFFGKKLKWLFYNKFSLVLIFLLSAFLSRINKNGIVVYEIRKLKQRINKCR
ncbi:hypothetical protein CO154_01925 [Candidatus Pacearchaeota archaeon CG_4_9_14_3_um_filter_31_7]|nr:MAG: hypothetical protein AUJ10_03345 [Candidatus Pacearchaeota archaeon CG1_02_31_27]PIN92442.1 MAG: hypothetical protein COU55_01405 [Candidatus Pacearchaeota archaeon CG10_big_fil_rev_8_21_14_0_10_31_59]PIZ81026.1 MAG: hypothetical protein COX99_01105 [Candidatus Pacearchaeota archaeon CG_4_10_14_0_2_um_filter_31_10]PJA70629.1 MAG: hypothetical protein CO154_01925 [Candidatus Pacearchaeota archaeon CG_4_9_14_3_um_filter_31_7]